jgi:hypothetical protein
MKKILWQLIAHSDGRRVSHTKFFSSLAYFVATVAFVYLVYQGRDSTEHWIIYLGTLAGHHTASKLISHKYENPEKSINTNEMDKH